MLALADVAIEEFLPTFAENGIDVAFLVPTPTGYEKSIMDATSSIRELLCSKNIHDYKTQIQGQNGKKFVSAHFVNANSLQTTKASLYRPKTKNGDPRIWFYGLKQYCKPRNLLALLIIEKEIYVFNLSDRRISNSLLRKDFVYSIMQKASDIRLGFASELLQKIQIIHNKGFLPSVTIGDPGVGDTLEHELGINRNPSQKPDYKGIELKSTRISRDGIERKKTRSSLFAKVPDSGMSYREIVEKFGKWQIPREGTEARLQLYETLRVSRFNAYDLKLGIDLKNDILKILSLSSNNMQYISSWQMENLRHLLQNKHNETFWVKAVSKTIDSIEYFRYDSVTHTRAPNISLFSPLIEADRITVDLAGHFKADRCFRNHGMLFKIHPDDISLLFGEEKTYSL